MSTKIRARYKPDIVLANWREVIDALPHMNETELKAALDKEMAKPEAERRNDVLGRLHRRYTKVRQEREKQELLQ